MRSPTSTLRGRILIPLTIGMTLLVVTFATLLVQAHRRDLRSDLTRDLTATQSYLEGKLATEGRLMEAVLRTLSQSDAIVEAFLDGDRDRLLTLANPIFEDLRANHHVSHLYFSGPDRVNLLRVHRPEQFGDTIPRETTIDALRTGRGQRGIEIGRLRGLLTLRVVLPWYLEGRLIGVLELGQEIDYFAEELQSVLGLEAFVLVPKDLVDREAWSAGMAFLGREGDWDLLPEQIVSAGTLSTVPEALRSARLASEPEAYELIAMNDRVYHGGSLPLRGRDGGQVGSLLVLRDRTEEIAAARQRLALAIGLCVLIAVVLESVLRTLVSRYFFEPLKDLRRVAVRAGQGQLTQTVTVRRSDELGELGRAINQMIRDLREANEAWERRLVESALGAVVTLDEDGLIIGWNQRAKAMLQWSDDSPLDRSFLDLVLPREQGWILLEALARVEGVDPDLATEPETVDVTAMRTDGSTFTAEISIAAISGAESDRFAVFLRDVTEARQAQGLLRDSERRFRELVETAGVVPWMAEADTGRLVYVGPQAEGLLGYPREQHYEDDWHETVVHPDDYTDFRNFLNKAVLLGRAEVEYRMVRADGETVWVRDIATLTGGDAHEARIQGFRFDITERKALEEQLFRSQKMDAIGRLAGGVAHDFNNLMTVVIGNAQLMEASLPPDADVRTDVEEIKKAGTRAADLTQQLLAFASKQMVRPKVLDLPHQIGDLERMLRRLIGEDIEFDTDYAKDAWPVLMDPGRLEQVLVNMAVNARDAMPEGGRFIVRVDNAVVEPPAHAGQEVPPGRYARIEVSDNGEGMSRSVQRSIFEPFFTTKGVGEGTGLGLSTCMGIVSQAGGYLRVYSEVGRGTTFRIYLPAADERADADVEAVDHAPEGGTETILVAEDEAQVGSLVERTLTAAGYRVVLTEDGRDAMKAITETDGRIDLLLTDMVMPFCDGRAVADAVRGHNPRARVLYMSGYSEALASHFLAEPDSDDLLSKPFTPTELLRRVRNALDDARV